MQISKLVDKQFEMEGIDFDYTRIVNSPIVTYTVKGKEKKDYWYNLYFFSSQAMYEKWKEWALKYIDLKLFYELDGKYGMAYKY